ncbi:hypothetical protein [Chryseobacterium lathyri]|uniref:DNA topoisomerase (ATP-hydrolyzing) n=1 Tax=Chryseobacterium lathyri TaxID=395933 RepID=A0ABT9SK61_9FLAO|nr:hypothetical protein [Chryseobacterium lathyri]MDP9959823.1 DNA gyrase/topoisomerase IV subunit B [Chryseobacterium lathyri]
MEEKKYTESSIKSLDWKEHIWLRPRMYFEKCFEENNLNSIALEIFCPAIDEYFDNNCSEIYLGIKENSIQIEYNSGMELRETYGNTVAENFMTKLMACKNEKKHLEVGKKYCLLGIATINASAERCELNTIWNKQKGYFIFENGSTVFRKISSTDSSDDFTKISFEMSKEIFGDLKFEFSDLQLRLASLKEKLPNLKMELYEL